MSAYVDNMRAGYGRMVMCHMIADTPQELREMALKIGVQLKWIQNPDTYREHFDICMSKREVAVKHGAREITMTELARILKVKRGGERK